jgi:hypothetical protein
MAMAGFVACPADHERGTKRSSSLGLYGILQVFILHLLRSLPNVCDVVLQVACTLLCYRGTMAADIASI